MERVAECHCGALRVSAPGEPDRGVYVCYCNACQLRTGALYLKGGVRIENESKIYSLGGAG
jgi:hypothetical protein